MCIIDVEGLTEKRVKEPAFNETQFDPVITAAHSHISAEFNDKFGLEYINAVASYEIVLLHQPTSTLIEADLLFNWPAAVFGIDRIANVRIVE